MDKKLTEISKFLSYVLRHKPESIGIKLDKEGWANIQELIEAAKAKENKAITVDQILEIVAQNDKKRFELGELGTMIRAVQGHSTDAVDRTFVAKVPPVILYHGTAERFVESIKKSGLLPQSRHHVHLSSDIETAVKVGQRHGKVVVIEVDAKAMLADSHRFYQAENGVWLTDAVPVKYLKF
jgi:putative RNA 2'-phosphotransferase